MKGETIRIPNDPTLANQLKNHLNVIKSREKKVFLDLDLDFISSTISVEPFGKHLNPETFDGYQIKLIAPKKRRTYAVFALDKKDNKDELASVTV